MTSPRSDTERSADHQYYMNRREKKIARQKLYYQEHRKERLAYQKIYDEKRRKISPAEKEKEPEE